MANTTPRFAKEQRIADYAVGTLVRFYVQINPPDQGEHPDSLPAIPIGTRAKVLENDGQIVLLSFLTLSQAAHNSILAGHTVRLYPRPLSEEHYSLDTVRLS